MKVPVISERGRPYILVGHDAQEGWGANLGPGGNWSGVDVRGQVNVRHQARGACHQVGGPDRPIAVELSTLVGPLS